jgi:wyosine [tRNA(Phe)-imidazoG37] synthetase (radical SAM superfamily)
MMPSWIQLLQDKIIFGRRTKRFTRNLLTSSSITGSLLYRRLYERRMNREMARLSQRPLFIRVETTNRCTADCSFCPHKDMRRPVRVMDVSLYERIVAQAKRMGIDRINLHGFGEPFMDPFILQRIATARASNIGHIATNSNGVALNDTLIEGCLDHGLDEIYISIDAATENVYKLIRPGLSFDRVEGNIRKLAEARRRRKSTRLKIYLSFVECRENSHEVKAFLRKWSRRVDGISISYLHNWGDRLNFDHRVSNAARRDPCRHLWLGMDVNVEGKVPLCCYDYETQTPLGDLTTQDIAEVWHGGILAGYRECHRRLDYDRIPLCRGCNANDHNKNPWWLSK